MGHEIVNTKYIFKTITYKSVLKNIGHYKITKVKP
jgi:hypothetical protein